MHGRIKGKGAREKRQGKRERGRDGGDGMKEEIEVELKEWREKGSEKERWRAN